MSERRSDTSATGRSFVRGKTIDDDERRRGRPQAARIVRRMTEKRSAAKPSRSGKKRLYSRAPRKPIPKGPSHKEAARRVTVKVSYAQNRKPGQWAKHGKYLQREGTQKDGKAGLGFDALSDNVDMSARLDEWQLADDQRLFKVVLSPEDGDRLDLQSYTREYMSRLSPHLAENSAQIEWMAIAHYNTAHPHVHLLIRGNHNLQIPRDLLQHGMRNLASEISTERLGYRTLSEIAKAKELEIEARKLTPLDREIEKMAQPLPDVRSVVIEQPLLPGDEQFEAQRRRMARLEALERLGLAEKVGISAWALDQGWTKGLKELEILRTRTAMVAQSRALMTEPRCLPQVTKLKPGERLVGRVLGAGLDEQNDRLFLLIEGTDYKAHIVYQSRSIENARDLGELKIRNLVALEGKSFATKEGKTVSYISATDYQLEIPDRAKSVTIPQKALEDALDAGQQPSPDATTGFQRHWHEQLLERQRQRQKEKAREREKSQKVAKPGMGDELE